MSSCRLGRLRVGAQGKVLLCVLHGARSFWSTKQAVATTLQVVNLRENFKLPVSGSGRGGWEDLGRSDSEVLSFTLV